MVSKIIDGTVKFMLAPAFGLRRRDAMSGPREILKARDTGQRAGTIKAKAGILNAGNSQCRTQMLGLWHGWA